MSSEYPQGTRCSRKQPQNAQNPQKLPSAAPLSHCHVACVQLAAAIAVHTGLGPGLLESAYETCLALELSNAGLGIERQKPVPLVYRGVVVDCAYRLDLLVNGEVVVEIKSVDGVLRFLRILRLL